MDSMDGMEKQEMTLGSLFDGFGGWLIAAKKNGIRPVWRSPALITSCQL